MIANQQFDSYPVRGLRNLGNSCYLNSVLQVFTATSGVREHFLFNMEALKAIKAAQNAGKGEEVALTLSMRQLIAQMHAHGKAEEAVHPVHVLKAVSRRHDIYGRRAEQDSHEVLRQLLEGLRDEMEKAAKAASREQADEDKKEKTLIDDLFCGDVRSSIVCLNCGAVSCSNEPFLDMSLPIPRTKTAAGSWAAAVGGSGDASSSSNGADIAGVVAAADANGEDGSGTAAPLEAIGSAIAASDVLSKLPAELTSAHEQKRLTGCLQAFAAPEILQGENAYVCDECLKAARARAAKVGEEPPAADKVRQPAVRWLQIMRVPRVLTLHLKRFRAMGRRVHKLDEHVPFPARLDLSAFTCAAGDPVKHFSQLDGSGGSAAAAAAGGMMRLYGVIEHEGSFSGGHYIAYVRLAEQWYRMSDSQVTRVDEEAVLRKQAFMLFYERE